MQKYSLRFGQTPINVIKRPEAIKTVCDNLLLDYPISNSYIITGVRGCGKTVLLTNIAKMLQKKADWLVIDVNPEKEILSQIASSIYESPHFKKIFPKVSFSFSFHGFGISIEGKEPAANIKTVVEKMLDSLNKKGIKLLVTIDEVSNTGNVRAFIHDFQSLIRDDYPVFLLMAGLGENVESLQNNKSLTFLLRTPKIHLGPLNTEDIAKNYESNLQVDEETAKKMSELTKGYAFAFQVVGLLYGKYENIDSIYDDLDTYLSLYVYNKIWSSIPNGEKRILKCFKSEESLPTKELLDMTGLDEKMFSSYRSRLLKRGVVVSTEFGSLSLVLPRFNVFISRQLD